MDYLLVALGAAILGAFFMHLSYRRAAVARREERNAMKSREDMAYAERMRLKAERDAADLENQRLLQEAAHNAGWHEGYRAAQNDKTAVGKADGLMGMIAENLHNGRSVAVGFGVPTK